MKVRVMAAFAALLFAFVSTSAQARSHHKHHVSTQRAPAIITCNRFGCSDWRMAEQHDTPQRAIHIVARETTHRVRQAYANIRDIKFIPNPPGTWRIALSCAHRLAAYWGLGHGLDSVSTWPQVFARAYGPGVGLAAVRRDRHHIMGIIGGGPGAWLVADFNSGRHLNREYTVSDFHGYFFVDPRTRIAVR